VIAVLWKDSSLYEQSSVYRGVSMAAHKLKSGPSSRVTASPSVVHHEVVIVGGGTAGITVAARLTNGWFNHLDVAVVEPSARHFYQPAWTLVGAGAYRKQDTVRDEAAVMPRKATWIRDAVETFDPENNRIVTHEGTVITYKYLVVAAGIQINWGSIPGLKESVGHDGVCSNYSFETVESTWETLKNFKGGTALFTQPKGAVKCGGAPQKIAYLAEDYLRIHGLRDKTRIVFAAPVNEIFAVEKYRNVLQQVVERKGIETMFEHELVAIHPDRREAVLEHVETHALTTMSYDMLHVTPPMSAPDFISRSVLADSKGWVDVNPQTLQHTRFPNVFALGDCSNLPTSKTGAAIRKQAPVLVRNLRAFMAGQPLQAAYPGLERWSWPSSVTTSSLTRRFRSIRRRNAGRCGSSKSTCCRSCIGTACSRGGCRTENGFFASGDLHWNEN